MSEPEAVWHAVRCFFRWKEWEGAPYEERVTVWLAESLDEAMRLGCAEADEYADANGLVHLGRAQAYLIGGSEPIQPGSEVFSLLRDSELEPPGYLDAHFHTGREHTQEDDDEDDEDQEDEE